MKESIHENFVIWGHGNKPALHNLFPHPSTGLQISGFNHFSDYVEESDSQNLALMMMPIQVHPDSSIGGFA